MNTRAASLLIAFACLVGVIAPPGLRAQTANAPQWTEYHNRKWNFCGAYPAGWKAVELFNGDQLRISPGDGRDDAPTFILAAFNNAHTESANYKSLDDVAEDYEDDIRDNMVKELTSQNKNTNIAGMPALITTRSFVLDGQRWHARELRVERPDHVIVEAFLRAPHETFAAAERTFDQMVSQRLRVQCSGK